MTHPALARMQRGFSRMGAAVRRVPARFDAWWHERPDPTPGQIEQERETNVSLGLMAAAADAGAEMTPEQQIFLSQSEHGMRERLSVLLGIPHRSLAQEREKVAIEAWLARAANPVNPVNPANSGQSWLNPANSGQGRLRTFLGPAAVMPGLGLLASPVAWVAVAFAVPAIGATVQTMRLNHAKSDLMETREQLEQAVAEREGWRERAEQYAAAVTDAREAAQQTAEAWAAERRAQARRAARERRRQREIQDVLTNSPEPPAWSLRNDGPVSE